MKTIYSYLTAILALTASIMLPSCSDRTDFPDPADPENSADHMRLELAISVGDPSRADADPSATTADPESRIDDILVMLFTPDATLGRPAILWKAIEGRNLEDFADGKKRFDITVGFDPKTVPAKLVAVAVANAADQLAAIKAGEGMNWSYEDCRQKLLTDYDARMESHNGGKPLFTMWGIAEKEIETDLQVQTVRIHLCRDMGRVSISLSDDVAGENFRLAYALIYNRSNGISPMPALASLSIADNKVERPTLVASVENTECEKYTTRPYSEVADGITLYAAEQDVLMGSTTGNPADANRFKRPALIIGGYYRGKSDRVYWYRIDFTESGADGADRLIDLLRNHSYAINVKAVNGPGEDTPEEAYNAVTTHVDAEIVAWEDIDREAVFEGSNWIAAPRSVTMGPSAGDSAEVVLFTNVGPEVWEAAWGEAAADWESLAFGSCAKPIDATWVRAEFPAELAADGSASIKVSALTDLPEDMESRTLTLYLNVTPKLRMVLPVVQSRSAADGMITGWGEDNLYGEI